MKLFLCPLNFISLRVVTVAWNCFYFVVVIVVFLFLKQAQDHHINQYFMLFIPLLVLAIDHVFNLDIQKLNIAPWNFPNFLYWAIFFFRPVDDYRKSYKPSLWWYIWKFLSIYLFRKMAISVGWIKSLE